MSERKERKVLSIQEAMEQNADYFGFDLCDRINIGGNDIVEIYFRDLLDSDTKRRVDRVYAEYDSCDRQQIDVTDKDGKITKLEGGFKEPRQKDGDIFDLDEQVSIAVWGEDVYKRFVEAGGPPGLILMTWGRMRQQIMDRASRDPKSL